VAWRRVGDGSAGRSSGCGKGATRVVRTVCARKAPGNAFVLGIVLNNGGKILCLIDHERLSLRRDADGDRCCGHNYGDGCRGGLRRISDGRCGENDGSGTGHLRWPGVGDGGAGSTGSCGKRAAGAWIAIGERPRHAFTLGVIRDGSGEGVCLPRLERYGGRRNGHGCCRLGRGCIGGRRTSGWGRGVRARNRRYGSTAAGQEGGEQAEHSYSTGCKSDSSHPGV